MIKLYFKDKTKAPLKWDLVINKRFRLGAESEDEDGIWVVFENAKTEEDFEKVASSFLGLLNT
ncbi:hypothetical protein [Peribacillus simplex]|uniref:hypothetical protein n=1 Tax=Peribacillus simplex TaxID=1478 RepID=UPI00366F8368